MSLSYGINVSGINASIFWNCSREDAESVYEVCYDALQEECKGNEKAGLGYNGLVILTIRGLEAYYHINKLAEKLFKEDKEMNVEKSMFLRKLCNEYTKAFYTSRNIDSLFYGMADSSIFNAESFKSAAKELDKFLEITVEARNIVYENF